MTESPRILVVAGDASQRNLIVRALEREELRVESAANCEAAYRRLLDGRFEAVVIDLASSLDAIELIKRIRATPEPGGTRVLVIGKWGTGQPTLALSYGADAYEPAPIYERRLADSVERLLHHHAVVVE